jgi:hypothetical protein
MQTLQKRLCVGFISGEKLKRINLRIVCKSSAQSNNLSAWSGLAGE